ncbi:MAG: permease-like cell division protein FtsX [Candidatus Levyibacteriota bacterium]
MRHIKNSWKNIRRSPYQAIAAIIIMTLTFLTISFFTFLILGSSKIVSFFESKPQVTAFFKNEAKQADINALKTSLEASEKVASVKFVSKEEALKIYREQNKDDPLLLDLVTADILPSSLEISAIKIEDLTGISETLKSSPIVQEVIFQKDVVSTLTSWTSALRTIGVVLVVVLSLASVFIMVTIVGIKISQRKEDIEIMKLIGATSWHIRWPFIYEGIFYGVAGAFIGWMFSSAVLLYASPFLGSFLKGIPIFPISYVFFVVLLGIEILIAIILGAFSSFMAVLRYLK